MFKLENYISCQPLPMTGIMGCYRKINSYFCHYMSAKFPKKERLKSKKIIDRLFLEGNTLMRFPLKLIYLKTPLSANTKVQVAVAVPKRSFGKAVTRNRIKRLMRESYRLNKAPVFNNLEGSFAFLFLYIGKEMPTFKEVERSMLALFKQFILHKNDDESK